MLDSLFSAFAPHYCLSCGEIGAQICDHCFYDIELQLRQTCFVCHGLLMAQQCSSCESVRGVTQLVLGERDGIAARLIDRYKFGHTREAYKLLARLFDAHAPYLPEGSCLVPIPTASSHIRRRGFDHTRDIARALARRRNLKYAPLLVRRHNKAQVGASATQRKRQAAEAFKVSRTPLSPDTLYILCDDIVTTGASLGAAAARLREAGAERIVALALVQQPWK